MEAQKQQGCLAALLNKYLAKLLNQHLPGATKGVIYTT